MGGHPSELRMRCGFLRLLRSTEFFHGRVSLLRGGGTPEAVLMGLRGADSSSSTKIEDMIEARLRSRRGAGGRKGALSFELSCSECQFLQRTTVGAVCEVWLSSRLSLSDSRDGSSVVDAFVVGVWWCLLTKVLDANISILRCSTRLMRVSRLFILSAEGATVGRLTRLGDRLSITSRESTKLEAAVERSACCLVRPLREDADMGRVRGS